MNVTLTTWIAVPLLGGVIGYVTNRIAVKMIFRPIRPVNVLGLKIQGLIGRRQGDLAQSIGDVVGDHLVQHADIVQGFRNVDLESMLGEVIEKGLAPKVEQLRNLPLIGGFLTPDRIDDLRGAIIQGILDHKDLILERLEQAVEAGIDVQKMVREKVEAFPVERLEKLVLKVASRELRAIEILGGFLGVLIGIGQVAVIWSLSGSTPS
jgi:uncharacterized membrane protein YheB (UPF0754 family)